MALSRECYIFIEISEVRPAYRNCKLRGNTDGMHGWSLKLREHARGTQPISYSLVTLLES